MPCVSSRTSYAASRLAIESLTSSTATSTSPTSASRTASSARSLAPCVRSRATFFHTRRSRAVCDRLGRWAPPRCACKRASRRTSRGDSYIDLCRVVKEAAPEVHIHAFSPEEVKFGASLKRVSYAEYLAELKEAGLGTLPGTSAEILDDRSAKGDLAHADHDRGVAGRDHRGPRARDSYDLDHDVWTRRIGRGPHAAHGLASQRPARDRRASPSSSRFRSSTRKRRCLRRATCPACVRGRLATTCCVCTRRRASCSAATSPTFRPLG